MRIEESIHCENCIGYDICMRNQPEAEYPSTYVNTYCHEHDVDCEKLEELSYRLDNWEVVFDDIVSKGGEECKEFYRKLNDKFGLM